MPDEVEQNQLTEQEKAIQQIKERKQIYLTTFETAEGKAVLKDLERVCFIHKPTYHEQANRMAFNEGHRAVILHIKSMMNIDIEATEKLIKQQNQEGDA